MTGTVCLQGGGEFSAACRPMDAALVARVPGRIVVTALAGAPGQDYRAATANGVRHFMEVGGDDVVGAPDVREDPDGALAALRSARLLVLPGGSPTRLLRALQGTAAGQVVADLLAAGGAVLGASAGAMVLCGWTVLPDSGLAVVPGLGLLPELLIVPHWDGGRGDWLRAIEAVVPSDVTVLGVPEESGVRQQDGELTAVGRSSTALLRDGRELQVGSAWRPA
ncbi:MAG: Type 1 glutamine amidotransferase-like domain-containing protein [Mycobacteriales bacterium]